MRRGLIVLLVAGLALVLSACNWDQLRFGPENTGVNPFENTISASNVSQLAQRFTAQPGFNPSPPVLDNGVVYVTASSNGRSDGTLKAFDANGVTRCSGSPPTCSALWTTPDIYPTGFSPVVANGLVYVSGRNGMVSNNDTVMVFDAAGTTDCSGTPKVCNPEWTYTVPTGYIDGLVSMTVANGVLVAGGNSDHIYAFDAAGTTDCSGTPRVCQPMWLAQAGGGLAISHGIVYASQAGYDGVAIDTYDAAGNTNCSGSPSICTPLWSDQTGNVGPYIGGGVPTVANGLVYFAIGAGTTTSPGTLEAFDANGNTDCSGSPKVCSPLLSTTATGYTSWPPIVANGKVYLTTDSPGGNLGGGYLDVFALPPPSG
jgi:hypothetical protein